MRNSKWGKFTRTSNKVSTTSRVTMSLRMCKRKDGEVVVQQLIEHVDDNGLIVTTEWVEIPTVYEVDE